MILDGPQHRAERPDDARPVVRLTLELSLGYLDRRQHFPVTWMCGLVDCPYLHRAPAAGPHHRGYPKDALGGRLPMPDVVRGGAEVAQR